MSFTSEFWLILGLTLVLGWVLGLMSRSGGKRWKRELAAEREAHSASKRDYEARIAAHDKRIAEYERARAAPVYREDAVVRDARHDTPGPGERVEIDENGDRVIRPIR